MARSLSSRENRHPDARPRFCNRALSDGREPWSLVQEQSRWTRPNSRAPPGRPPDSPNLFQYRALDHRALDPPIASLVQQYKAVKSSDPRRLARRDLRTHARTLALVQTSDDEPCALLRARGRS